MSSPADQQLESAVVTRLMWRLMPFLFLLYIVAYLDRINVGFAILQMREQLHLTDRMYGRAAGMFFAGYFFFQVPSNLLLEKMGVRRWICGLMVLWGVISCCMIFIRGPVSFYALRFLLGAAEAGFFPGMILYMKNWFPANARARAVAWFMTANPLAGFVGSPISGALLGMRGLGLSGWQWLFLMEGLPAVLLGVVVYFFLTDKPANAKWLPEREKTWLIDELGREAGMHPASEKGAIWAVLADWRVWVLSLVYFALPACMYGITFWLPTAIHSLEGLSNIETGVVAAIPYLATAIAMVVVGTHSDRTGERPWHTALSAFSGAAALGLAAYLRLPIIVIIGMCVGMMGAQSMAGPFWALATARVSGIAAAAAIAVINSIGNLGGYYGPYMIGLMRSSNGDFRGGLLAIGGAMAVGGTLALVAGSGKRSTASG